MFLSPVGRASKLGAPSLAYYEDNDYLDDATGKITRFPNHLSTEKGRIGRATTRSSPPRVYRRTISAAATGRQDFATHSSYAVTASTPSANASTAESSTPSAVTQETKTRQPIKRRTQRSHTDQLFGQNAPIARNEFEGLDDEELEEYAAQSDSLVQALTLSKNPKANDVSGRATPMTKGSKTLVGARGLSREKGLDKKKSRSRTTSCSQQ